MSYWYYSQLNLCVAYFCGLFRPEVFANQLNRWGDRLIEVASRRGYNALHAPRAVVRHLREVSRIVTSGSSQSAALTAFPAFRLRIMGRAEPDFV